MPSVENPGDMPERNHNRKLTPFEKASKLSENKYRAGDKVLGKDGVNLIITSIVDGQIMCSLFYKPETQPFLVDQSEICLPEKLEVQQQLNGMKVLGIDLTDPDNNPIK